MACHDKSHSTCSKNVKPRIYTGVFPAKIKNTRVTRTIFTSTLENRPVDPGSIEGK